MKEDQSIVDRVKGKLDLELGGIITADISPRATAVRYDNEINIYFESGSYWVPDEEIIGSERLFPSCLRRDGLGVLPGSMRVPRVRNYDDALTLARLVLKPVNEEAEWYDKPSDVKIYGAKITKSGSGLRMWRCGGYRLMLPELI